MKRLIYLFLVLLLIYSCEDNREKVMVKYQISNAYSPVETKYKNADGNIIGEIIIFESAEDNWQYSFEKERGEIVYLSARYNDSTSSVKLMIIIDGKVYKQGSSVNEPEKYITISGTIPY